jgi:hypothetical protein
MKFLKLAPDSIDIEPSSYARYLEHLDSIENHLPRALFEMLRFPEQAYNVGRTIYDSILIEWRDLLNRKTWKTEAHVKILTPNFDQEFVFTFNDPTITLPSSDSSVFRLGELYCLEVSRLEESAFSFCFMYMSRTEIRIDCSSFLFVERSLASPTH